MNPFRENLKREGARIAINMCKRFGDLVVFQDRSTSKPFFVWCVPEKSQLDLENRPALSEQETKRNFVVPRQEGCWCGRDECQCDRDSLPRFPPENDPSANCTIGYEDWTWSMKRGRWDSVGASYVLECVRHVPRRIAPGVGLEA
jgi:hypothetical protein